MKVYTKTGDKGQTSLLSKERVFKDHLRVQAYGTVDEANSAMGLARSFSSKEWLNNIVYDIQVELISLNADLATADLENSQGYRLNSSHVEKLETIIDQLEARRIPQSHFVTPGSTTVSAALDLARTIVRRAERCVVGLQREEQVSSAVSLYLNRLSDLLFVMARCEEQEEVISRVTEAVEMALSEPQPASAATTQMQLNLAKMIIETAEKKALEIGIPMVITIVDTGGNPVAQHRMDDALLASISISMDKAYTAVALRMATEKAAEFAQPGKQLYGINTTNNGQIVIFGGGLPIYINGVLIGGIGVSGGSVEEDITVAKAGISVI
ncbi:MAG: cob(I)yrinic acid a,c-diamide adenosyltransferase [Methylocystaceae bacterium]